MNVIPIACVVFRPRNPISNRACSIIAPNIPICFVSPTATLLEPVVFDRCVGWHKLDDDFHVFSMRAVDQVLEIFLRAVLRICVFEIDHRIAIVFVLVDLEHGA